MQYQFFFIFSTPGGIFKRCGPKMNVLFTQSIQVQKQNKNQAYKFYSRRK